MFGIFSSIFILSILAAVSAHFAPFSINGISTTSANSPLRVVQPSSKRNSPTFVEQPEVRCSIGVSDFAIAQQILSVSPGSTIEILFRIEYDINGIVIDPSHKGPCAAYLSPLSKTSSTGWVKFWEDVLVDNKFCTTRLIESGGLLKFTIPPIPSGRYVLRTEALALHEADAIEGSGRGAQWY